MVHNCRLASLGLYESVWPLLHRNVGLHVAHHVEADADEATHDEIKLVNFLGFFDNNHVIVDALKPPRKQSLGYVIEHQLVYVAILKLAKAEKTLELAQEIVEEVVGADLTLYFERKNIHISQFLIFEILITIICLVIVEIVLDYSL